MSHLCTLGLIFTILLFGISYANASETIPFVSTFAGTDTRGDIDDSALNSTFSVISDIELDTNGDMYVVDALNGKIRIIYSNGTVSTYVDGRALDASFTPYGIKLGHSGNLYVTDDRNHKILIIHSNGTVSTYAGTGVSGSLDGPALNATFYRPFGLELDSSGNLYVADVYNHKIRIIYSNGTVSTYAGTGVSGSLDGPASSATFAHPQYIELDPHGNLYVTDTGNNKIRIIHSNGTVSTYAGTGGYGSLDGPALNATFYRPFGLELDSSGNLYVADYRNHKIRIIYSNGTVSTFAGTGGYGSLDGPALNATFYYTLGLELDSSGNLYVSSYVNIRKITTNSLPSSPPPIITLIGNNPQIIEQGLNYTELGATTNDNSIITINDSSVDTNTLGNYTVIYYTIGDFGNIESLVNRTVIIRDSPILYTLLLNDTFDSTLDDWQFFGATGYQATHSSEHGGSAYVFGEDAYTMVGIEKNITIPYASSENFVLYDDLLLSLDFRVKATTTDSSVTNSRIAVYDSLTNELLYDEYLVRGKYLDTEWRSFNINLDSYVADHNSITIKLLLSDSWHAPYEQQNWFDNILLEVMPDNNEPVITLFGNNPQNTSLGYGYVELGAMTDDGSPIVINNTEFIDARGTYSIYYDSTDLLGNDATQVVRTVNVVDTITLYHYTFTSTTEDWEHIGSSSFTTSHDSEHGGSLHIYENTIADGINNFGSQKTINISKASDVLVLSFDYKIEANPGDDTISLTIYDSVTLDSLYSTIVTSGVPETGWRSFSQDIYPYVNNSDSIIISLSIRGGFNNYDLYPNGWFDNIKLDTVYVEPVIGTIPFVSTFAGNDTRSDIDDSALNSTFHGIFDIELDTNGDMYVADGYNRKIRIIYSNGTVSTYVDVSFIPHRIELDHSGNLYVTDPHNHKIRIIHSNGTVSTYAGTGVSGSLDGPISSATFRSPYDIELDPHGNLYVADGNKIRIIYSNGTVSTYAGTGARGSLDGPALNATFVHPRYIELDPHGNLYVTDTGNNKIRIIHSNGTVSTYAGTGVSGSLDGPALNATFYHPHGLELDSSGNLYVADYRNYKIRIIYSNGTVSTFAGTGGYGSLDGPALNATFRSPVGLELDSSGNLYVSSYDNIRKITTNSLPFSPPPIITLIGDNPQIIERGLNYTELGATINDNSIITINDSSVDTNTLGNYIVIYYTIGDSGNIESLVNRTVIIRDSPILYTLLLNDTFDSTLDDWQFFGATGYQATHSSEHGGSAYVFGEDALKVAGIEKNITIPYASSENFVLDGDLLLSLDFRVKATTTDSSVTNSRIAVYDSLTNEPLYYEYLVRGKYLDTEWRSFNINLDSYVADHNSITIKLLLSDSWHALYEQQNWFDNILLEVMPDNNEPVITLFGNNPQNTSLGYGYVELGAMTDDGSPIVINNTEFIDAIGTYSIYYDSTDLLGNDATQVVRTVNVVDTITLYHYTFTSTTEDWEHIGNLGFTTSHDSEHGGSLHIHENTVADGINNFGSQKTINISKASDVLVLSFDYKIEANPGDDTISLTIYDSVTLDSLYSTIVTSGVPETGWRSFSQDIYPYVNNSDSIIISLSIRGGFNNYDLYPNGWFDNIKLDTVYVEPVIGTIPFVSTFAGNDTYGDIDDSALNSTFNEIYDIELDTNGDMYVADGFNGKIRIIYSNGTVSTYVDGRALNASFSPFGIELDHSGNLYVTDPHNNKIRIIHSNGTVSTYAGTGVSGSLDGPALNATFDHPLGLELDSSGNLYVTDSHNNKIRIIYSNGTVSTYAGTGASGSLDGPALNATFNHPIGLELDSSGNLYVASLYNHNIRIIYSNGTVSTYAGTGGDESLDGPALNATFYHPIGLELDSSGNLYVADFFNNKIRIIHSNGTVSTFAGTGGYGSLDGPALNATFSYPIGLELDSSGNLYVSTIINIRKITTNSLPPSPLPIITLIGDNPQIIERGLNYTELGATTNDDSIITINDSSVDTNTLGNYTVIYYTIGDSGNIESLVNRTVIIRDLPILYTLLLNDTFDSTLDDWQFFGTTRYQATHSSEHGGSAHVFGEAVNKVVGIEKNITIPYASSENFVLDGDLLLSLDFRAKSTHTGSSVTNSRIAVYDSLTNELLYYEYLVRGKYLDTEWRSFNINLDSYVADHNSITIKLLLSDSWHALYEQQNWFDNILLEVMPDNNEPVITLFGNNPQNTSLGYGYVELGAMTDDGSPIVINNTEFIDAIGTYSIYYDSTDLVGNNATQVVRTVNVVDAITLYHYTFTSTTEDWEHIGSSSYTTSHDSEHGGSLHIYQNKRATYSINNFGSQKTINISEANDVLVLSFDYKIEANPDDDIISLTIYDSVTSDSLYSTIVTSGVPETGWRSFSQDIYPYVNNSDSIIISLSIRDGLNIYNLYPHGWFDNIKLDTVYVESVIDTTPPIITLIGDNPQIIERGLNYTELGATTNDNSIITINDSSVDTNTLGNYTVIYYTIGDSGNIESLVNRTVIIRDLPILYTLLLNDTFDSTLDDWQFFGTTGYQATHSSEHGGSAYVFGEDAYTMVGIEKNITIPYASSENFVLDGDLLLSFDFRAKSTTFDSSVTNSRITVYDSLTNELLYDEYLVRGKYLDTEWRSFNINLDSYVADHNSITIKLLLSDSWLSQHRQQNWFDNILLEVMPDIREPVITLLGNNPQNTSLGYGYVELGAMTDDGSPIVINNTEFIDAIGTYSIYYDSTDLVGNNATQVVRTVNVVDTITLYHYTFTSTTEDWEHIGSSSFTTSHDSEHGGSLHIYENTIADGINNFGSQKIINISKASDVLVLSFDYKIEANPGEDIISLTIYDSVTLDSLYSTIVTSGVPETGWRSFSQDIYPYVNNSDSIIISLSIRDGFSIYNLYPHGWFDNIKLDTVYVESVIDTTPPIITLIGDNPQIIERGLNYTELGATTNDNSIITINDSSVDTNTLGNYTVIYYTIGDSGNIESLVNRTVIIRDLPILYTLLLNDTFDSTLDDWQFFGTTGYQATHSSEHGGSAYVFGEDAYTMVGIEKNITIPYASSENFVLDGDLLLSFDFRAKSTTFDSSVTNSRITVYDSLTNELLYDEYLVRGKYLDTEWRSFNINLDSYVADHNSITIKLLLSDSWLSQHRQQNWFDNILLEVMPDIREPVITLLGNNPQNTSLGYGYVELGAMTDDGSPIVINNTEFIDAIGTYSIYYDSTDLVGNNATQVVRTVNVVDTITLYHYTFTSTTEDWEHIGSSSYTTSHDSEHGGSLHIYENTIADGINNFGSQKTINISKASDVLVLSFDYKIEANPGEDIISLTIYDSVTLDSLYSTIVTSGVPETGWRSFSQDIYPYVNNSDSIIISLSIRDGFSIYNLYPHGWFDNIKLDTVYVESVIDTTPPIITLIGDNPQIIERGLNYTELGATTNDNSIITINDSSVDTNTLGNYTVIYYTIGDSGNIESLVNRTVIIRDLPILYTLLLNDTFDSTLDDWQFFGTTGYQATHSSEHGGSAYVFGEDAYTMVGIEKNITIPYASSENFVLDGDLLLSFDFRAKSTTFDSSVTNSRITVYDSLTNELLYDEYLVRGKYLDTEWRSFNINLDSYVADHNSITIKLLLSDSWLSQHRQQNWFDNILLEVMPDIREPVITLLGNNPQNTSLGYGYVELGAMTDDGSPIVINNTEFIDAIGTYSIYYDSTDLVGNNATQVVRTVNVVDTITLYHYTFTSTTEDWEHIGSSSFTTSHDSEHGGSLHIYENTIADGINNFGSQKTINISKASDVLVLSFDYKIEANPGEDIISLTIYDSVTLDSLYSTIVTSGVPETGWRSFSQDIYPYVNNSDSIIISLSIRDGFSIYNLYPHGWFDNIKLDTVYVE